MMELGLYEQIITKMFEYKLKQMDDQNYYIGTKQIDKSNVASYLSRYLYSIFEQVFSSLNKDDESVQKAIDLANSIIKTLARDLYLDDTNIISAQSEILTAVIDKTQFVLIK